MEKMTLHKALGELKILDSRIQTATQQGIFIQLNKKSNQQINGMTVRDYEDKVITASYQKVTDLIERRRKIKDALTKQNAVIEFSINDETFTIATAIDRKNTIQSEKLLLQTMKSQYNSAITNFNRTNENLEKEALVEAQRFFEGKDTVDITKIRSLQEEYINSRSLVILDPISLREKIEKLEENLVEFEKEIDYKLSELNALNFIEIE